MSAAELIDLIKEWLPQIATFLGLPAVAALAASQYTKSAIEARFNSRLEREKQEHETSIQRLEHEHQRKLAQAEEQALKEIEATKFELQLTHEWARAEIEPQREVLMEIARLRVTSYPVLVSILRRMKTVVQSLYHATSDPHMSKSQEVLDNLLRERHSIPNAMYELANLEAKFDKKLSDIRLFSSTSDYQLQTFVQNLLRDYNGFTTILRDQDFSLEDFSEDSRKMLNDRQDEMFRVTAEKSQAALRCYNDDLALLSEQLYRPILPKHSDIEAYQIGAYGQEFLSEILENLDAAARNGEGSLSLNEAVLMTNPANLPKLKPDK